MRASSNAFSGARAKPSSSVFVPRSMRFSPICAAISRASSRLVASRRPIKAEKPQPSRDKWPGRFARVFANVSRAEGDAGGSRVHCGCGLPPGNRRARSGANLELDLGPTRIKTTNRIAMIGRPDVVYGCTIELADVARALAAHTGTSSLLIQLKPDRKADCQLLGPTQSVVLRADNGALIDRIAGAINGSCCMAATAHPLTAAKHPAGPSKRIVSMPPVATTRAATRPADAPMMSVDDWVETDGVFAFVRIRNASNRPVLITDG